jgi:hypothetical protein
MVVRVYRILKYLILTLVVLILGAVMVLWLQGDALVRRYTPEVEAELGRHLRAHVRISDLKIDLLPSLGAIANGVTIVPLGSCSEVTANSAELRVDPRALLSGRYVINSLAFSGITADMALIDGVLSLRTDPGAECIKQGAESAQASRQTQNEESRSAKEEQDAETFSLELKDFAVRDAQIVLRTSRLHHVHVSRLVGAAALAEGVLLLQQPDVRAEVDGFPINLLARSIRADFVQSILEVSEAGLSVNGQSAAFSGRYGPGSQLSDGKLKTSSFYMHKLVGVARAIGFDLSMIRSGEVSLSSEVSYSSSGELSIRTADLQVKNLSIVGQESSYQASLIRGPVQCVITKQRTDCSADLMLGGFGFMSGDVEVSNVSAHLERFKTTIPSRGDVKASGLLTGSSLHLKSPTVEVKRIGSVSAPLEVSIPAKGGYSVQGDVTGRGVELQVQDREFSEVGGVVKMSLTAAGDSFKTSALSANVTGHPVSLEGLVTISPSSYSFRDMKANVAGGEIALAGDVQRTADRPFSARLTVNNAVVSTLATLILARQENPFDGQIRSLNVSLKGLIRSLPRSLSGEGDFKLMSTRIRGFDLTRALADALSSIPIANLTLSKEKLTDDGLDKMAEGIFTITEEKLNFSSLTFYRQQYTLQAIGSYSFSKVVDLRGSVTFMKQTLSGLGGGFEQLGSLLGRVGKVEIPIFIRGQVPNLSVVPDVVNLVKDNSGVTLAGEVLGTTLNAGRSVADFVLSPFESRRNKQDSPKE